MSSSLRRTNSELYLSQIDPLLSLQPEAKRARREEQIQEKVQPDTPQHTLNHPSTLSHNAALEVFSDIKSGDLHPLPSGYKTCTDLLSTHETYSPMSPWPLLNEIALHVFSYLNFPDLLTLASTCSWNEKFLSFKEVRNQLEISDQAQFYFEKKQTTPSIQIDEKWLMSPNNSLNEVLANLKKDSLISSLQISHRYLNMQSFQLFFDLSIQSLQLYECINFSLPFKKFFTDDISENPSKSHYLKEFSIETEHEINGSLLADFIHKMPNLEAFCFKGNLQLGTEAALFHALRILPRLTALSYNSNSPLALDPLFFTSCDYSFPSLKQISIKFKSLEDICEFQNALGTLPEQITVNFKIPIKRALTFDDSDEDMG